MRGDGAVFQSARNPNPSEAVRVHDKRTVSGDGVIALRTLCRLVVRRLLLCEIGNVETSPLAFLLIPPNQFLALTPGSPVRFCRRAIVQNAAVAGPCVSPAV